MPAVPWVKWGFSQLFVLLTLFFAGVPYAFAVLIAKCLLGGMFSGFLSIWYSLAAGTASLLVGTVCFRFGSRFFGVPAVSAVSSAVHNAVQIVMAYLLMGSKGLLYFLPVSAALGMGTGALIGALAWFCLRFLLKREFFREN